MSGLVVTADFGPDFWEVWMEMAKLCPMGKLYRPYIFIQIVIQLTSKTAQAEQQKRFSDDVKFTKKCTNSNVHIPFGTKMADVNANVSEKSQPRQVDMLGIISSVTTYPCYNQRRYPLLW